MGSKEGLHWMEHAFGAHPGAMTRAAKAEGESNSEYIAQHQHASGHAGQMARLASIGKKYGGGKKKKA